MGTNRVLIACLLWVLALSYANADERSNLRFASAPSGPPQPQVNLNQQFQIPEITQDDRFDPVISEWVAESVMNFAHDLAIALDRNDYPNTQIFSPLSVMSALSLLQMGSNGKSYNQLSKLFSMLTARGSWKIHEEFGWLLEDVMLNSENLRRPRNESEWRKTPANKSAYGNGGQNTPDEHTIRIANGLFVQEDFHLRKEYQEAAQSVYKSEVTPLNFRTKRDHAKHYINSWVNQNTLGKIPAIIADEINSDTNMIIASALYFKGFWEQPFLGSGTAEANFFPDGEANQAVRVQLMAAGGVFPYYDSPEYNCRIIGLPYKGNTTTMYIIQPHGATRRNLNDLQRILTGTKINELISKMERKTAVVAFPKFHVTNTLHLKDPLIKMGIEDIFQNGASDLSLIVDEGSPYLQRLPEAALRPILAARPPPSINAFQQAPPALQLQPAASAYDQSVQRAQAHGITDRYSDAPLIFSRFGEISNNSVPTLRPGQHAQMQWTQEGDLMTGTVLAPQQRPKRTVTYKVESEFMRSNLPLRLKDLIISKRITKTNPGKKSSRSRRQAISPSSASLQNLDQIRSTPNLRKPQLYVDDILHKVDFEVNEQGTEAAAATLTYLRRSGTDVAFRCDAPFLVLVRHDPTKLPLFYGKVNIPLA